MTVLEVFLSAAKPMTYAEVHAEARIGIDEAWSELQRLVAEKKIVERNDGKSPYTYEIKK